MGHKEEFELRRKLEKETNHARDAANRARQTSEMTEVKFNQLETDLSKASDELAKSKKTVLELKRKHQDLEKELEEESSRMSITVRPSVSRAPRRSRVGATYQYTLEEFSEYCKNLEHENKLLRGGEQDDGGGYSMSEYAVYCASLERENESVRAELDKVARRSLPTNT